MLVGGEDNIQVVPTPYFCENLAQSLAFEVESTVLPAEHAFHICLFHKQRIICTKHSLLAGHQRYIAPFADVFAARHTHTATNQRYSGLLAIETADVKPGS